MPYKRISNKIYTKTTGTWKLKQTCLNIPNAKTALRLLNSIEKRNQKIRVKRHYRKVNGKLSIVMSHSRKKQRINPNYSWVGYKKEPIPYVHKKSAYRTKRKYEREGFVSTVKYFKDFGWYVYYAPKSTIAQHTKNIIN